MTDAPRALPAWLPPLLLALLSIGLYAPTLNFGLVYDDRFLIADNTSVTPARKDLSVAFELFGREYWEGVQSNQSAALQPHGQPGGHRHEKICRRKYRLVQQDERHAQSRVVNVKIDRLIEVRHLLPLRQVERLRVGVGKPINAAPLRHAITVPLHRLGSHCRHQPRRRPRR